MSCFLKKERNLLLLTAALVLALFAGCAGDGEKTGTGPGGGTTTEGMPGTSYSWRGFPLPVKSPQDAEILVEKLVPKSVRPHQKFTFKILIRNNAAYKINKVTITEEMPKGFTFIKAIPVPMTRETALKWDLGTLNPGEKKQILITGKPSKIGTVRYSGETVLNFKVATDSDFASTVNVIEPNLAFKLKAPKSALINQQIPVRIEFVNRGEAEVIAAKLVHTLPKGLLTYEGKSKIEKEIGNLPPGAKKTYKLNLKGIATGSYKTTMTAVAEEGITASATLNIDITKPVLSIVGKAPKKRFVGNKSPYTLTVKNTGNATAENLAVKLVLPQGIILKSANEGGNKAGRVVTWNIKSLRPGESKKVTAMTVVKKIMVARAVATAKATAADQVETAMITDIAGIAGILSTLVDTNDPVPLGENEIYVITANNTGSLDATKIVVKCVLPDSMEFVKSTGATKGSLDGNVLTFEPLPALEPQAEAQWKVIVKALKPGDVRFKTSVESEQLDRPVNLIESTHFYK
jgi:uncharacterized repeat protein (TIGR01451 family)